MRACATLMALMLTAMPLAAEEEGAAIYARNCATCHGIEALGDGPMTEVLTLPVPGLTGLAAANGGTFPWLRVLHVVDGRTGLRGHGGPMPIFGEVLTGDTVAADAPDGSPVFVSARVLAVVDWLASIQQ